MTNDLAKWLLKQYNLLATDEMPDLHLRTCQTLKRLGPNAPAILGTVMSCDCPALNWWLADLAAKRKIVDAAVNDPFFVECDSPTASHDLTPPTQALRRAPRRPRGLPRRVATMNDQQWMTVDQVADHFGITPASARRLLSDNQVRVHRVYPADQVLAIRRPGRGTRTDLKVDSNETDTPAK